MMTRDMITDLILKVNLFISKRGQDVAIRQDLIKAINMVTGEDSLDAIYINNTDNFNIPDVVVMPLYHSDFSMFVMNPDDAETCPFGYTIEIHQRCFDKLEAEELTAVIIHDILQNVQSDTAKVRFMRAYNSVISSYQTERILDSFSELSHSEVTFMMFMEICCRPFRVPVTNHDYTGTDDVLKAMKLADAYDSYLSKTLPMSINDPEDVINREIANDYRDIETIIKACLDKDIRHYYTIIRNGVPLVTLDHILGNAKTTASLGFISRKRQFKHRYVPSSDTSGMKTITESYMNPKNEIELRFKIDKIISEMRYAESEAERSAILFRIKTLQLKLLKTLQHVDKQRLKDPTSKSYTEQCDIIHGFNAELDELRKKTTEMEIKTKVWRIYSKQDLPEGYQF